MTEQSTLSVTNTSYLLAGDDIGIEHIEDDPRLWKWLVAFVFRMDKPTVKVSSSHRIKSIDSETTITISETKP